MLRIEKPYWVTQCHVDSYMDEAWSPVWITQAFYWAKAEGDVRCLLAAFDRKSHALMSAIADMF